MLVSGHSDTWNRHLTVVGSTSLGDLGTWSGGLTPSKRVAAYWSHADVPWVTPKDMGEPVMRGSAEMLSAGAIAATGLVLFPPGSIVVVFRSGILRHTFPVAFGAVPFTVNQDLKVLRPRNGVVPRFAFHALHWLGPRVLATAVKTGTTVESVDVRTFERLSLLLPSEHEQRRIAEILDTADAAIQQTQAVIAKLHLVKAGARQELLAYGIGAAGEPRDPLRMTGEFQASPIGLVPRAWQLKRLGDVISDGGGVIQTGPFGSQLHAREYVDEGVPVIMPQDLSAGTVSVQQIARVREAKARELRRHRVLPGDVVLARRGELNRCAPISDEQEGWLCGTGCLLVRVGEAPVETRWLAATYSSDRTQRQIGARAVGSTMVNLNTRLLADLLIGWPPIEEQRQVLAVLNADEARIRVEQANHDKLKLLKKGLMDDLLTGRVRVSA